MGIITELLENDTDGSLRKHIVRAASAIGYVLVLGAVLFLGGLIWRMYNGSEVEIFGIRVATPDGETRISRAPPPDSAPAQPIPAQPIPAQPIPAQPGTPVASPAAAPAATSATQLHTIWMPMHGDGETCYQMSHEAMNRAQISNIQRNPTGLAGVLRKSGLPPVDVNVRCMFINGFSVAFAYALSPNGTASMELMDTLSREFTNRLGAQPIDRIGGTTDRQAEEWNWQFTRFETADQCRDHAQKAHEKLAPTSKVLSGPGVFSVIGQTRVATLCLQDGPRVTVVTTTNSFSREDAIRLRNAVAQEFEPMRR